MLEVLLEVSAARSCVIWKLNELTEDECTYPKSVLACNCAFNILYVQVSFINNKGKIGTFQKYEQLYNYFLKTKKNFIATNFEFPKNLLLL